MALVQKSVVVFYGFVGKEEQVENIQNKTNNYPEGHKKGGVIVTPGSL